MIRIRVVLLNLVVLGALVVNALGIGMQTAYAATASAAGEWTSVTIPDPVNFDTGGLYDISCPSANFCQAAGIYDDTNSQRRGLIAGYNGTSWSLASLTDPASTLDSVLNDVSCVSSTFCVAIGSYRDTNSNNDARGLMYTYNGTSWTSSTSPQPGPNQYIYLSDIDCVSTIFCKVVGGYQSNMQVEIHALAMEYDGTSWSLVNVPEPTGATNSSLQAVDCVSATFCQAVGNYTDGPSSAHTMIQGYNGTSWTEKVSADPLPTYDNVGLNEVQCVSTTFCQAIGGHYTFGHPRSGEVITKSFDGSVWTVATIANRTGFEDAEVYAMECASTTSCQAVGVYRDSSSNEYPYVQSYDNSGWKAAALPQPTGATFAGVSTLSCASATFCQSLGNYSKAGPTHHGLGVNYNGTAWSLGSGLEPAGYKYTNTADIDCPSTTSCHAIGTYTDHSNKTHLMAGSFTPTPDAAPGGSGTNPATSGTQNTSTTVAKAVKATVSQASDSDAVEQPTDDMGAIAAEPIDVITTIEDVIPSNGDQSESTETITIAPAGVNQRNWWFLIIAGGIVAAATIGLLINRRNAT